LVLWAALFVGLSAVIATVVLMSPRESLDQYVEQQIQVLGDMTENTKENAEKRVKRFALMKATDLAWAKHIADNYLRFNAARLGPKSWLVYCHDLTLNPSFPGLFAVVTDDGTVHSRADSSVWDMVKKELKPKFSDSDHERFLLRYLCLQGNGGEGYQVIGNVSEIPGYKSASLSSDLESQIRPPYWLSENIYQLMLYSEIGGRVLRYKCHYDSDGNFIDSEVEELARRIGSFRLYN
jgi:hypothetical protein